MSTTIAANSTSAAASFDEAKITSFRKKILHPILFPLFLLIKLPMGLIAGLRVREVDRQRCSVTVPFKWLTQNPFRSTYFACQAMAAEMSTGTLVLMAANALDVPVSTLVVGLDAEFTKKATGTTWFTCEMGDQIFEALAKARQTGEGVTLKTLSVGKDREGNEIARFHIHWSFKVKSKR